MSLPPEVMQQLLLLFEQLLAEAATFDFAMMERVDEKSCLITSSGAYVYVRQSTLDQLLHNHESRRRQYGLADRARTARLVRCGGYRRRSRSLGRWGQRPGFERLLVAICEARVGTVLAVEASRLARNGRDWHTLLEFCGLVGCLLADEDGVYDPRLPNDRLLLGMKGTMSEMELSLLRQRSFEALHQKARRGELFFTVAVGYRKARHDRIEMEPDLRVREAITLVFRKFSEFHSVRQVHLWLRQEEIRLPAVEHGSLGPQVIWKLPVYNTILHLLTNPIYGGAYAFGRTCSRVSVGTGVSGSSVAFVVREQSGRCCSPITTRDTSRGRSSEGTSA